MIIIRYSNTLLWSYQFDEKNSSEILGMCRIFKYFGKTVIVSSNTYLSVKYIAEYTFETRSKKKPTESVDKTRLYTMTIVVLSGASQDSHTFLLYVERI